MGKITKEDLKIIRTYFLTLDEGTRNHIRQTCVSELLNCIIIIENGFINDDSIDKILNSIGFTESSNVILPINSGNFNSKTNSDFDEFNDDLLSLKSEYFISLAESSLEGINNSDIEKLIASNNVTFKKLLIELSDNDTFEKDMSIALKSLHRDEMKKQFQKLDEEDEFELTDSEMQTAITGVEREKLRKQFKELDKTEEKNKVYKLITRFAFAAALIGVIIGGAYIGFFKNKVDNNSFLAQNDTTINNLPLLANNEIPNLIESKENINSIVTDLNGSGLAGSIKIKDSIHIKTNGLSKQIDTLRSILEKKIPDSTNGYGPIYSQMSKQLDSLLAILNSYSYDNKNKKVVLNVPQVTKVKNIISIDPNNLSQFYINLEGKYYLIKTTLTLVKLNRVTDENQIEELKKIEFLNE